MRLWSIHPCYLDAKGLVALWRESLLAKDVLWGKTRGYKYHPQLIRFKESANPIESINKYLLCIYEESLKRGYNFDKNKIACTGDNVIVDISSGQIKHEFIHLMNKLEKRDYEKYLEFRDTLKIHCNPIFKVYQGDVEKWEKINETF